MPNIFPWKLLRWSLVLRRFLRSIYFPTFLCLQALHCSGRVTFFQFILADKKLWEMARRGWLVVVIGRLHPLEIFFSLSGRHLCNIIKLWRMGTVPQFSCKKSVEMRQKIFFEARQKKILSKYLIYFLCLIQKKYHQWVHVWFHIFFPPKKGTSKNCTNIYSHLSIILGTSLQQFFGDQYIHILCWPTPHTAPYILANHAKLYLCWNDPKNSRIYDAI